MTDETKTVIPTNEQASAKYLREDIRDIAKQLRAMADRIEHQADDAAPRAKEGSSAYSTMASTVMHEITAALMNMPLTALIRDAAEADIAHANGD